MSSPVTGPPPPNVAEIFLPPGFTLESFQSLQGSLVTIAITVAVAFGVVVWDYFTQLPSEISLYMGADRNLWKTPATWFFIVLRYSGIVATLPALFFTSIQTRFCQAAVVISQVGVVLVVASSGAIFLFRVIALWNGSKVVYGTVAVFYTIMIGCWIAVATQYEAITGPPTPFLSNCQMLPIVSWAPISYASSVAFDTIVLGLTLGKFHLNTSSARSRVGKQVYQDNLLYFTLTTVTNITVLSIQALGRDFDLIKPTAVPFSTLMTVTMGTRVFLNLKLFNQRQAQGVANTLPFVASTELSNNSSSINSRPQMVLNTSGKGPSPYYNGKPFDGSKQ